MRQWRSHALSKGHSQFYECKTKETINSPSTVYYLWMSDEVWIRLPFVLREQSSPHESLNCLADCSVEWKYSLHLSCVIKPWGSLCPSLLITMSSKIVEGFVTALTQTAVFMYFVFFLLDWGTSRASCASDSSNIHANQTGIQQVSSLRRTHDNIKWRQRNIS